MAGLVFSGCSKHPTVAAEPIVTYSTNLGVVEVSDGVPIRHALGDGRTYILTPSIMKDGTIQTRLDLEVTNSSGTVEILRGATDGVLPGQTSHIGIDNISITMIPKARSL